MPLITEVVAHTDGGCVRHKKGNHGGWSVILLFEDGDGILRERELSGGEANTTNNRMEIQAVLTALKTLKRPCHVTVFSDSQYVVHSIGEWEGGKPKKGHTGWMTDWQRRGWRRKEGALKNVDLWKQIDDQVRRHLSVTMRWVRGHNGDHYNERCDVLATSAITRQQNGESATTNDGLPENGALNGGNGGGSAGAGQGQTVGPAGSGINRGQSAETLF